MIRRLTNLLTLLSLVLCLATAALWVRSYFVFDVIGWQGQRGAKVVGAVFASDSGAAGINMTVIDFSTASSGTPTEWMGGMWSPGGHRAVDVPTGNWRDSLWPRWDRIDDPGGNGLTPQDSRYLQVPYWLAFLVAFALPAHRIRRIIGERRRRRLNLCARCGYDLCATPQRCPECRTAIRP